MSGPKYINELKASAELRKKERERRKFKRFIEDGNPCKPDEEVFITKKYKEKLQELGYKRPESSNHRETHELDGKRMHSRYEDRRRSRSKERESSISDSKGDGEEKKRHSTQNTTSKVVSERDIKLEALRQKLAKKTKGDIFDAAVRRYQKRLVSERGFPYV